MQHPTQSILPLSSEWSGLHIVSPHNAEALRGLINNDTGFWDSPRRHDLKHIKNDYVAINENIICHGSMGIAVFSFWYLMPYTI